MPRVDEQVAVLVIPGLWEWLWRRRIDEYENDPRLCRSITGASAEDTEATRRRWLAAKRKAERSTPRECFTAGEPVVFPRWQLGRGKTWHADWIARHPMVADRTIRWLQVDAGDKVTISQEGP